VLCWAQVLRGELNEALIGLRELEEMSSTAGDALYLVVTSSLRAATLAYQGHIGAARTAVGVAFQHVADLFDAFTGIADATSAFVQLAAGDAARAWQTFEAATEHTAMDPQLAPMHNWAALAPLACGDLAAARRWADQVVSATAGWSLAAASTTRAYVEIAQGDLDAAGRDAHNALDLATSLKGDLLIPFVLDCLAMIAAAEDNRAPAARLFGAADTARQRMQIVRFKVLDADIDARIAVLRNSLGDNDFDAAWGEGAALSLEEAIAYAQRGRGERRRASSGWASLTRAELDVVRLIGEGLSNRDAATRLFISPRTVQAHLTHIYTKLGLTSRVQLAQEAARH
jgi:DNA-binding CsgD family transcriptional regulator